MPQVDVQWPSEDEDFDAKVGAVSAAAKVARKPKPSAAKVVDVPTVTDEVTAPEVPEEQEEQPSHEAEASVSQESEPASAEAEPEAAAAPSQPEPSFTPPASTPEAPMFGSQPPVTPATAKRKLGMPKMSRNVGRLAFEAVLVAAVIVLGLLYWNVSSDRKDLKAQVAGLNNNPQVAVQKQTQQLIGKVGQLIQLPKGETPTVAEVSDATQAKTQSSFFANAQNGDRVLMYVKAGEAILYRPSTNRIVLVAPLVFTNSGTSTKTSSTTSGSGSSSAKTSTTPPTTTSKTTGH